MAAIRTLALFFLTLAVATADEIPSEAGPPHVANPSFEEADDSGSGPRGWNFDGPAEAAAGAWTLDTPFHEKRALRIDARHGKQHWESSPVNVQPAQKYLLCWQARFAGEKSWRFRAEFCGVEVEFHDAAGKSLGVDRQHTHCWQTPGWQSAWFLFATLSETRSLIVRFVIRTSAPLPGGFDVDAVTLEATPPQSAADPAKRLLNLHIKDERGRPTAARVRIVDSGGQAVVAPGGISYALNGAAFHPLEEGPCHVDVLPGRYSVTVTKGFEYRPWTRTIDVADSNLDIQVELERAWDWRRRGWYCGDHHTHLHRHGGSLFPSLTWRDALRAARCEGLDFLPFMGADRYSLDADRHAAEVHRDDFVAELTDEMTEDFWGHVCPINVDAKSRKDPRHGSGPMNFDRDAAIAAGGGVLCYGHPYGPMAEARGLYPVADPSFGLIAREFPIDLALGMRCGFDLLTMEGDQNQLELKLRDLYRLYNLGFQPAITASTDFHVDQGRQVIGSVRTYVRSESLDMARIAAAYRKGRTFATNGPLIDLKVNGKGPGDELRIAGDGEKVSVSVEAVSIGRLDRVEIIVSGKVHHTFEPSEPHRISGTCEVPASKSLWIAAKAIGPDDPHLANTLEGRPLGDGQIAHTSPVYVIVGDQPILAAQPSDAAYFIDWCDAAEKAWRVHLTKTPSDAQYDKVILERVARAQQMFNGLKSKLKSVAEE